MTITRKHYLIQLDDRGTKYWLRRDGRTFKWYNHGKDKEYRTLGPAIKMARSLLARAHSPTPTINVVEVTFRLCNPELPDGYYEPVHTTVATF